MPEFAHGLVIGKFYPLHAGHSALIRTALARSARVTVEVLASSVESIALDTRVDWVRQEHPGARVVGAMDDAVVDYSSEAAWQEHVALFASLLDAPVDAVFSSDAYGEELARRLGAAWVQVDPGRTANPVSGTAVRADPAANWHWLSPGVREWMTQRVVVLGAESTGSTTLAEALSAELGAPWVPEYGRQYTLERDGGIAAPWRSDEFELIVDRQLAMEREAARRGPGPLLVCDTDVLATALWHERYVGEPSRRILQRAAAHPPALYLLTGDEIPFVQDGVRDGEHIRHAMQQRFRDVLAAQPVPWVELRGPVADRVATALPAIAAAVQSGLRFSDPMPSGG